MEPSPCDVGRRRKRKRAIVGAKCDAPALKADVPLVSGAPELAFFRAFRSAKSVRMCLPPEGIYLKSSGSCGRACGTVVICRCAFIWESRMCLFPLCFSLCLHVITVYILWRCHSVIVCFVVQKLFSPQLDSSASFEQIPAVHSVSTPRSRDPFLDHSRSL